MLNNEQKKYYLDKGKEFLESKNYEWAKDIFIECLKLDLLDTDFIIALANVEFKQMNFYKSKYLLDEAYKIKQSQRIINSINSVNEAIKKYNIEEKYLTAAFIVKNEEENLPNALNSIKDVVDEIIVVDTGSTDNTVEIAKSYGAKIYYFDWINDYSAARNISIKYATSKWIIYLDADEILSQESQKNIRNLIKNADENLAGFICDIQSDTFDDDNNPIIHSGYYPRLFRNIGYPILHFFGKVHEQISPSFIECGYIYEESSLVIKHTGYAISQKEIFEKVAVHLKTLTEHITAEPENGYAWYHLGNTLYQMGRREECKEILNNALICGNLSKHLNANTALLLSRIEEELGNINSALEYVDKSLKYINNYEPAIIRKNEILSNKM